jgi:hypothetical protein
MLAKDISPFDDLSIIFVEYLDFPVQNKPNHIICFSHQFFVFIDLYSADENERFSQIFVDLFEDGVI